MTKRPKTKLAHQIEPGDRIVLYGEKVTAVGRLQKFARKNEVPTFGIDVQRATRRAAVRISSDIERITLQ